MLDLIDELSKLTQALDGAGVPYALCGGLALAVWGKPRATLDIDLLVPSDAVDGVKAVARNCGYTFSAGPMTFAKSTVHIERVTKLDPETKAPLCLDLLLVSDETEPAWKSRRQVEWQGGLLWVVSREGLVSLKLLRGSGQDKDDIRNLTETAGD